MYNKENRIHNYNKDSVVYFCTRVKLYQRLMDAGCVFIGVCPNKWNPNMLAYRFLRDDKLNKIVDEFFEEVDNGTIA